MVVDLTSDIHTYEIKFRKIYFRKYLELRAEFTKWIDKNSFKNNLDWWLSIPASRNFNQIAKQYTFYISIFFLSNFLKTNKLKNGKKYVLIDTFLEGNNLKKNRFYGAKLIKKIEKKSNILFVPCLYMGMGIVNVIKNILIFKKNKNYVLKERHLNCFQSLEVLIIRV